MDFCYFYICTYILYYERPSRVRAVDGLLGLKSSWDRVVSIKPCSPLVSSRLSMRVQFDSQIFQQSIKREAPETSTEPCQSFAWQMSDVILERGLLGKHGSRASEPRGQLGSQVCEIRHRARRDGNAGTGKNSWKSGSRPGAWIWFDLITSEPPIFQITILFMLSWNIKMTGG